MKYELDVYNDKSHGFGCLSPIMINNVYHSALVVTYTIINTRCLYSKHESKARTDLYFFPVTNLSFISSIHIKLILKVYKHFVLPLNPFD